MDYIMKALEPGMLQVMLVAAGFLTFPLEKREKPVFRILIGLVIGFLCGGGLSLIDVEMIGMESYLFYTLEDILILGYVYLFFRFCTKLSVSDSIYAMACAYVAQHAAFCLTSVLAGIGFRPISTIGMLLFGWGIFILVGGILIIVTNRYMPINGYYLVPIRRALTMTCIVFLLAIVLPMAISWAGETGGEVARLVCLSYDLCSCLLFVWLQVGLRQEVQLLAWLKSERQIRRQMQEQYELSKSNIDLINHKCHDLKHQIAGLRFISDKKERDETLSEIEKSVMLYDTSVKTGNEVLDTVLTEKSLLCTDGGISWTCMADGAQMDFISPVDLYTLLGNALDNAIEGSQKLAQPEQRVIRVIIRQQFGAVFIQIANYFDYVKTKTDEQLETTKPDKENHGFGLSSIENIVKSYDGTMNIKMENSIFLLNILIPYPKAKKA